MYCKNELDSMPRIYKCRGNIKYLRFRIRLECAKSSMIPLPNLRERKVDSDPQYNEREEMEFSWNEKIFSAAEFAKYENSQNCHTDIELEYHDKINKLVTNGTTRLSNRLFTYTSNDKVAQTLHRNIYYEDDRKLYLNEVQISISPQRSDPEEPISLPVMNIINFNPSNELKKRNRSLHSGYEIMYIAADLSDKTTSSETPAENCGHLLVSIKWNRSDGTMTITPDFANFNTSGYKIDIATLNDTRYVYRYWIINVSPVEERSSLDRNYELTAKLSHYQTPLNFPLEFEEPCKDFLNIFVLVEIQKAVKFQCDNLFVRYFIDLPEGWTVDNPNLLSGFTQQCKSSGEIPVAQLSHLFELKFSLRVSELEKYDEDPSPYFKFKVPHLYLEVCSLDNWKRFRVEGYTWTPLPTLPGRHKLKLSSWRPAPLSQRDKLKRFFTGADREIPDFTYLGIPSNVDCALLSKYGFETVSAGDIFIELNTIRQIGKEIPAKKVSRSINKAKAVLLINSVNQVLGAFKKARERMLITKEQFFLQAE